MGNVPLSTSKQQQAQLSVPSCQPSRPFDASSSHHQKRTAKCLRQNMLLTKKKGSDSTTLQHLILRQDWQRVLIRMHLYPDELRQGFEIHVYDMDVQVYPLQLVCALYPPAPVVQLCVKLFPDAAALPLKVLRSTRMVAMKGNRRWHALRRSWKAWRSRRQGAFPVAPLEEDEWSTSVEQRQLLLPFVQDDISQVLPEGDDDDDEEQCSDPAMEQDDDDSSSCSSKSSLSSRHSMREEERSKQANPAKNVILQLSPSGGLAPLPVNTSNETESTSASSLSSIYRVKWDLKPLWTQVAERGMLLPLHIACLFQASAEVVESLVQAYPLAALSDVLGMLPIHWVAAGWTLPPLQPPPTSPVPREPKPGPLHTLHVLRRALPECIHIRSGNHAMIAQDYIRECMEEGDYKQVCLRVLSDGIDYMVEYGSFVSGDTLVFCDTDETSSYPSTRLFAGLSGLILDEEWSKAIAVVEEDPLSARKWYYGVDTETVGATVWKRLPIHCKYHYHLCHETWERRMKAVMKI